LSAPPDPLAAKEGRGERRGGEGEGRGRKREGRVGGGEGKGPPHILL